MLPQWSSSTPFRRTPSLGARDTCTEPNTFSVLRKAPSETQVRGPLPFPLGSPLFQTEGVRLGFLVPRPRRLSWVFPTPPETLLDPTEVDSRCNGLFVTLYESLLTGGGRRDVVFFMIQCTSDCKHVTPIRKSFSCVLNYKIYIFI